jgi:hypothetical protein
VPEHQKQQTTVARFIPAALDRLNQPFNLAPGEMLALAPARMPARQCSPFFGVFLRSSFCRMFGLLDGPQTRMNKGPGFWTFYKRYHFVES